MLLPNKSCLLFSTLLVSLIKDNTCPYITCLTGILRLSIKTESLFKKKITLSLLIIGNQHRLALLVFVMTDKVQLLKIIANCREIRGHVYHD